MKLVAYLLAFSPFTIMVLASTDNLNRCELPPSIKSGWWRHDPVFLKARDGTQVLGLPNEHEGLPLGIPFEFESPLFKGQMLIRLRNAKSDSPEEHNAYFAGRKRLMQTVVQGKFKKPLPMSDVFVGSLFRQPFKKVPPPFVVRIMDAVISRVSPGVILDIASKSPKVLALYAGSAQTLSVDVPGQEPDISAVDIPENASRSFGSNFKSVSSRKKKMGSPKSAIKYKFDTEHVYTFHTYDDAMDYGAYTMHLPMFGDFDLSKAIGDQPMNLSAVTSKGDAMFSFDLWHKKVYPRSENEDEA